MIHPLPSVHLLLTLFAGPLLVAQATEAGVFYEHHDFEGEYLTLYPGEGIPYLADYLLNDWEDWNDEISSVAVWGGVDVYLYEDVRYEGDYLRLTDHTSVLGAWNDEASSLFVDYAVSEGWFYDYTLQSWVYEDGGWIYHDAGLGWIYDAYFNPAVGEGWLWDMKRGWIYTALDLYPWFYSETEGLLFYEHGTRTPRFWYSQGYGWFED